MVKNSILGTYTLLGANESNSVMCPLFFFCFCRDDDDGKKNCSMSLFQWFPSERRIRTVFVYFFYRCKGNIKSLFPTRATTTTDTTMYDFHDSTDTLKFWTEKRAINKTFFFHLILMKLGEVVVTHKYYNFTKFQQNWMKNKKVLLIARFSVQNFKVSVELWKSYIVMRCRY